MLRWLLYTVAQNKSAGGKFHTTRRSRGILSLNLTKCFTNPFRTFLLNFVQISSGLHEGKACMRSHKTTVLFKWKRRTLSRSVFKVSAATNTVGVFWVLKHYRNIFFKLAVLFRAVLYRQLGWLSERRNSLCARISSALIGSWSLKAQSERRSQCTLRARIPSNL